MNIIEWVLVVCIVNLEVFAVYIGAVVSANMFPYVSPELSGFGFFSGMVSLVMPVYVWFFGERESVKKWFVGLFMMTWIYVLAEMGQIISEDGWLTSCDDYEYGKWSELSEFDISQAEFCWVMVSHVMSFVLLGIFGVWMIGPVYRAARGMNKRENDRLPDCWS